MYEAEVKYQLVVKRFSPIDGWSVIVHLDPMELCRGGRHPSDKAEAVEQAKIGLEGAGVALGVNRSCPVDIVAEHDHLGRYLIEVKGQGKQQKELAFYSAVGQLLTKLGEPPWNGTPALAFPDEQGWAKQASKIPVWLREYLKLEVFLVSSSGIRSLFGKPKM